MFDPHFSYLDPNALPPVLRAASLVLSLAIVGIILFQTATTAAAVVA
jgi:hypothetical protein